MRYQWRLWSIVFVACAHGALGCGPLRPEPTTPEGVTRDFAAALSENDYQRAYKRMSAGYRRRVPFEQFQERLAAAPEETVALVNALSSSTKHSGRNDLIRYGEDRFLKLEPSGDSWRIATDLTIFYDQSTPRAALVSFLRAVENRKYNVVLRFIPSDERITITSEDLSKYWSGQYRHSLERLLTSLRDNLKVPIEEVGDVALMPYGSRFCVQFCRENGVWKIQALQ
jgi:hypothetical protein